MSFFKQRINIDDKYEKIDKGIHIERDMEGYWTVVHTNRKQTLVCTDKKEKARDVGHQLNEFINWDTDADVLEFLKNNDKDIYNQVVGIINQNKVEKVLNGLYLNTKDHENNIEYIVMDGRRQKKVKGIFIVEGLCVHEEEDNVWSLDHVPTAFMLSTVKGKEAAINMAEKIKTYFTWSDKNIPDLIKESKDLRKYFSELKQMAERGEELPSLPEIFEYHLIFMQTPQIKQNWSIFESAWKELDNMVGLESVKEQIKKLIAQIRGRMRVKGKVKKQNSSMHMVFAGSPGTGKTDVAQIMSRLLFSLGYLRKKDYKKVQYADIIGMHKGETETNMRKAIEDAMGGVLFLDEAYTFAEDDLGRKAIDVLLERMDANKSDFVVIVAGYKHRMHELMKVNPGLPSRFRYHIDFMDYTPSQLVEIALRMIKSEGLKVEDGVKDSLLVAVESRCKNGAFEGNARDVRNLVDQIMEEFYIRIGRSQEEDSTVLLIEDVKESTKQRLSINEQAGLVEVREKALKKLQALIGMAELKEEVNNILNEIAIERQSYELGIPTERTRKHMIFGGPAGTGKTTVAKIMGEFLKGSGWLSNGHFKKVGRQDLVGEYQGHSATKTSKVLDEALGGVLLIDEAYNLVTSPQDSFGLEAVATLIDKMEENKDDSVVILAGYEKPIEKLLSYNEGFESRIGYRFTFPNYTTSDVIEITKIHLRNSSFILTQEVEETIQDVIQQKAKTNGGVFEGNGRWASNFSGRIGTERTKRLTPLGISNLTKEDLLTLMPEDIQNAITYMK